MGKIFYKQLEEYINEYEEVSLITFIRRSEENIIINKALKSDNSLIFKNEDNLEYYTNVIKKINIENCEDKLRIDENLEVIIENIKGNPHLIICGGGHIALPLCSIAKMLEFNVTIVDDREEFANKERFTQADSVICNEFDEALETVTYSNNSYFVIVTRGHKADQICLEKILRKNFKYLGMIGSKGKVANSIKQLREKNYTDEDIVRVNAPIGLKIGAQTPAEIAVSIMAEIISKKSNDNISNIDEEILNSISTSKNSLVQVKILDKIGSSPRGVGAKMIVFEDGSFKGTIGGGAVENAAYERSLELIKEKKSHIENYDLSNSYAAKLGMACGGQIRVLFEYIN